MVLLWTPPSDRYASICLCLASALCHLFNARVKKPGKAMIRKLPSGKYRLYSRSKNLKTGKRRNLGTFDTRAGAVKHEREVQYFKRHG
jgi:hypothetical protein